VSVIVVAAAATAIIGAYYNTEAHMGPAVEKYPTMATSFLDPLRES